MTNLFKSNWQATGFTVLAIASALHGQLITWSKVTETLTYHVVNMIIK